MKANLCKCNNCDSILIDENPQIDAIEYDLSKLPKIKPLIMDYLEIEGEGIYPVCPKCKTDDYLSDHINELSEL
jgi:hypothetical protein